MEIGTTSTYSKTITDADVRQFADIVGDHNPVHLDDEYAATTRFGKRIAHGMLSASVISAALANFASGAIYLGQNLKFKAPVFIGDTVTVTLVCTKYLEGKRIAVFSSNVTNQHGETVIEGEATILLPA